MSPTLIIAGSIRPRRIVMQVAAWVAEVGVEATGSAFEVIDLRDWPLPVDGEEEMPQTGIYSSPQTIAWSRKIEGASAFVFVTPQYNWGYPAPLKHAIDQIYKEWRGKPAMIVSYGGQGGGKCAEQLHQVLEGVGMAPIALRPALKLSRTLIEANSGEIDAATEFEAHREELAHAHLQLAAKRDGRE